ncbi:acetylxylan esterase [Bacillus thuringiensis]|uniref:alpha/beta hydrolase n=1 Tax=Bacillus thuringiensis TaxID=1428 RepID=UPI000BF8C2DD|nr:alpha/beta hydrolase [Bacillus thuringiensis]PEW73453.1 acetylxylan esterase [Bacillus thuringiensis]
MGREVLFIRKSIKFNAEGTTLRGWLYLPLTSNKEKKPIVVMAHGYAGVKEMHLDRYAEQFSKAGLAVLVFDHRNFGESDGMPRQEINPWQQIEDYRHAITFASTIPEIDNDLIGVWGTSYSGGHVLVVGATDKRVKCVVAQVPTISGSETAIRRANGDVLSELLTQFSEDRKSRQKGKHPTYYSVIPSEELPSAVYKTNDAIDFSTQSSKEAKNFINKVTLRSVELSRGYEPGHYISKISPTPLLLLIAENDNITHTDLALAAYEKALQPKQLILLPGDHFDPYIKYFELSCKSAMDWFLVHLLK